MTIPHQLPAQCSDKICNQIREMIRLSTGDDCEMIELTRVWGWARLGEGRLDRVSLSADGAVVAGQIEAFFIKFPQNKEEQQQIFLTIQAGQAMRSAEVFGNDIISILNDDLCVDCFDIEFGLGDDNDDDEQTLSTAWDFTWTIKSAVDANGNHVANRLQDNVIASNALSVHEKLFKANH